MEAKPINYLTDNERIKSKNDGDKLQHRVEE
jgi:hypothetical protein